MRMEARTQKKVSVFKISGYMWIGPEDLSKRQSLSTTVLFSTLIPTIIINVGFI